MLQVRVGILQFCTPPQSSKTISKELESNFSDAIKLMWLKKVYLVK